MHFNQEPMIDWTPEMPSRGKQRGHGGTREGAGRPRIFDDKIRVGLDIERDDFDALQEIAEAKGESTPAVIRKAIRSYLNRQRRS